MISVVCSIFSCAFMSDVRKLCVVCSVLIGCMTHRIFFSIFFINLMDCHLTLETVTNDVM